MIVDLFGGPGGWEEALRMLGVEKVVVGIEHDAAACATRAAAGHLTIRADVARYPVEPFIGKVWGLIGSPPCPPFSAAGKRGGARDEEQLRLHLLACAGAGWSDPEPPEGGWTDPRSPLVLQPLRWAEALRPEWIILEQVPLVARLWSAMAVALEALGYRTKVALVQAADYGVPQTRQRAVLIACLSSWPTIPRPTHAKEATISRQRWISMAAALGWDPSLVGFARRDDRGDSPTGYRERDLRDTDQPAFTVTEKARSWQRELVRLPTGQSGARSKETRRGADEPAPTVAFGHNASSWVWEEGEEEGVRVEVRRGPRPGDEPGANLAEGFDPVEEPAQTVTSRVDRWQIRQPTPMPTPCIIGEGTPNERGYLRISIDGKLEYAHRVAWIKAHGPIPEETPCVLHRCDNPPCINEEHLFLGTRADNVRDMDEKGRANRIGSGPNEGSFQPEDERLVGESNPRAKLSDEQVEEIRRRRSAGELLSALAAEFGVSGAQISNIALGKQRRLTLSTGRDWKEGGSREDSQMIDMEEQPAPAFTGKAGGQWWIERPATTLQGDPRVFVPGGHIAHDGRDNSKMKGRSEDAVRISVPEALMLQSFPADYPVDGLRTPQHIALGRAVELDDASADEIEGDLLQRVVHFSVLGVAGEDDEVLQCVVVADSVDVVHDLLALRPGDSAVLRDEGASGEDVAALAGSGRSAGLPAFVRIERITVQPPLLPVFGAEATSDRLAFAVLARRLRRPPVEAEPAVAGALVVHEAEAASGMLPVASFEVAEAHRSRSCRPAGSVKTKQFEQIGNAVPPLLGAHLLAALVGMPPP